MPRSRLSSRHASVRSVFVIVGAPAFVLVALMNAYRDEVYWGRPVPGFGDPAARLVIIGSLVLMVVNWLIGAIVKK